MVRFKSRPSIYTPKMDYRSRIEALAKYINRNFIAEASTDIYCENPPIDLILATKESERKRLCPVTTTMLLLNTLLGNNTLIEGGSGTGKTVLSSVVGSMLYQLPIEVFTWKKIIGSPGATVNEIYAGIDISAINQGKPAAFLHFPFHLPVLIIDELNRYSSLEQNRIREGVATGVWSYADTSWFIKDQVVVSAINPEDYGGTFQLNENLADNYAITLRPPHFNEVAHELTVSRADRKIREELGLEEKVVSLLDFYQKNKMDPKKIARELEKLQENTCEEFRERSLPFLHNGELKQVKESVEKMPFDNEALLFFYAMTAELNYSKKFGRNRLEDPASDSNHDTPYLSCSVREGVHGRLFTDWQQISKAIAWYRGKDKVEVADVKAGFLYTAPRRISPERTFFQTVFTGPRTLPIRHALAKELARKAHENYASYATPQNQSFNTVRKAVEYINRTSTLDQNTIHEAKRILGNTDHPIGTMIMDAIIEKFMEQK